MGKGITANPENIKGSHQVIHNNKQKNIWIDTFSLGDSSGRLKGLWMMLMYENIPWKKNEWEQDPRHPLPCTMTVYCHSLFLFHGSQPLFRSSLVPECGLSSLPNIYYLSQWVWMKYLCQGRKKATLVFTKGQRHKFVPTQTGDQRRTPQSNHIHKHSKKSTY